MNPFGITERKCRKSDYPFFRNLIKNTLHQYVSKYAPFDFRYVKDSFDSTWKSVRILMKGKRRIGLYQLIEKGKVLEVFRIFIIPNYQRKGIGKYYMEYFETLGYGKIILELWDNNPAVKFYKKLGYRITHKRNHKIFIEKTTSSASCSPIKGHD